MAGVRAQRVYLASTGDSIINKSIISGAGQVWHWSLSAPDQDDLIQAIPGLHALRSVVERNDWHHIDAFQQSMRLFEWVKQLPISLLEAIDVPEGMVRAELARVVDPERSRYTTQELLAFAALIHDVGKSETFQMLPGGHTRCPGHEATSARMAPDQCARFGFSQAEIRYITTLVGAHGEPYALFKEVATLPISQQEERIRHFQVEHGPYLQTLLLLAFGDLVTSDLETNKPQKYAIVLDWHQRLVRGAFREDHEDNGIKDVQ